MNAEQNETGWRRFFWGLGLFAVSASTVAFVIDTYLMATIALIIVGIYLMFTGLTGWRLR